MFKNKVILKLFFQFCSPRAYDLGFERDAAEDLWKVNNRDEHEGVANNRERDMKKETTEVLNLSRHRG